MSLPNIKLDKYIKDNLSNGKSLGVCFKILLNYLHMIAIVSSFDLRWPFYTRDFFSFQGLMGNVSTQFFSIECFSKGINIDRYIINF